MSKKRLASFRGEKRQARAPTEDEELPPGSLVLGLLKPVVLR